MPPVLRALCCDVCDVSMTPSSTPLLSSLPHPQARLLPPARPFPTLLAASTAALSARRVSTPCVRSSRSTGVARRPLRAPGAPASQTLTPARPCSSSVPRSVPPLPPSLLPRPSTPSACFSACVLFYSGCGVKLLDVKSVTRCSFPLCFSLFCFFVLF